ncbi:MAG: tetratricopeptide repeat protein [Kofleriaceae bacterium]|nr:tetratricopeptide repeat protein [Kofleriaceae bacterium]
MKNPSRTLLALSIVLAPAVATAQPAPNTGSGAPAENATSADKESPALAEARSLFIEGNAHYSAGRYVLAAERFLRAYQLSGKPALLFNLANTYERAGDYEKAAHYLRMYLDGGEVHDVAAVKARLQRLEAAVLELQKPKTDAGPKADKPADPTPDNTIGPATRDTAESSAPSRAPYYIAGSGIVLGAAAAVTFGLLANGQQKDIDRLCRDGGDGLLCQPGGDTYVDKQHKFALVSDIGTGVAAASLVVGAIYFFATRGGGDADASAPSVSVLPSTSGDGFGFVASGRF